MFPWVLINVIGRQLHVRFRLLVRFPFEKRLIVSRRLQLALDHGIHRLGAITILDESPVDDGDNQAAGGLPWRLRLHRLRAYRRNRRHHS